jgi:acyl-CoA synthetase (NDP forming)
VPRLPDSVSTDLGRLLPAGAAVANPVDLAGAGERDLGSYARAVETVVASGAVDAVLLTGYFGSYGRYTPTLTGAETAAAERLADAAAGQRVPLVVHSMSESSPALSVMQEAGVPAYRTIESAAAALAGAAELALLPGRRLPPRGPASGSGIAAPGPGAAGYHYWAAREQLAAAGIPFPAAALVADRSAAVAVAAGLRAPYVLKAAWLPHKSEHGGVALGLASAAAVGEAFAAMAARLGPGPYVVEEMVGGEPGAEGAAEVIVGARRDPCFGPVILVGAGGTEAELYRDTAVELAPVTPDGAAAMLRRLRCFPLLDGWRGRPRTDLEALADLTAALSRVFAARPDLYEAELNPVRVTAKGVMAVDALVLAR